MSMFQRGQSIDLVHSDASSSTLAQHRAIPLKTPQFCDAVFTVGSTQIRAVRALVATGGERLGALLGDKWWETTYLPQKIDVTAATAGKLEPPLSASTFKQVIDFVHGGCTVVDGPLEILELMRAAAYFVLPDLQALCVSASAALTSPEHVIKLLQGAIKAREEGIVAACWAYVDAHAAEVLECREFASAELEETTVCAILSRSSLQLADEISVYRALIRWGRAQPSGDGKSLREHLARALTHLRIAYLPTAFLMATVRSSGLLELDVILNAVAYQAEHEAIDERLRCSAVFQPRDYRDLEVASQLQSPVRRRQLSETMQSASQ